MEGLRAEVEQMGEVLVDLQTEVRVQGVAYLYTGKGISQTKVSNALPCKIYGGAIRAQLVSRESQGNDSTAL